MSFFHIGDETNEQRQTRLDAEYASYVAGNKANGIESINYMNWVTGKKFNEKIAKGQIAFERRDKRR